MVLAVICQLAHDVVWHPLHEGMQGPHQRLPCWYQLRICPNLQKATKWYILCIGPVLQLEELAKVCQA